MSDANQLGALGILIGDRLGEAFTGYSLSAAALLLTLFYRPQAGITELAAISGIAQPTAVRVLNGLVARGAVERRPRKGRATPLVLTPAGHADALRLQEARLEAMERLLEPLSDAERDALSSVLAKLLAGATTSRPAARTICRLCDHPNCLEPDCPVGSRASLIESRSIEEPE